MLASAVHRALLVVGLLFVMNANASEDYDSFEELFQLTRVAGAKNAATLRQALDVDYAMFVIGKEKFVEVAEVDGFGQIEVLWIDSGRHTSRGMYNPNFPGEIRVGVVDGGWRLTLPFLPQLRAKLEALLAGSDMGALFAPRFNRAEKFLGVHRGASGTYALRSFMDALVHSEFPWLRLHKFGMKAAIEDAQEQLLGLEALAYTLPVEISPASVHDDWNFPRGPFLRYQVASHFTGSLGSVELMGATPLGSLMPTVMKGWETHTCHTVSQAAEDHDGRAAFGGNLTWKRAKCKGKTRVRKRDAEPAKEYFDFIGRNAATEVSKIVIYATPIHVTKHTFRGLNYDVVPSGSRGAVRWNSSFSDIIALYEEMFSFTEHIVSVKTAEGRARDVVDVVNEIDGDVGHPLYRKLQTYKHLSGVRVEVETESALFRDACDNALLALEHVTTLERRGFVFLKPLSFCRVIADYWGVLALAMCTNLFSGTERFAVTGSQNSRMGLMKLLRSVGMSYGGDNKDGTFRVQVGYNNTFFFNLEALLNSEHDEDVFIMYRLEEVVSWLAVIVPCRSKWGLRKILEATERYTTNVLPKIPANRRGRAEAVIEAARKFVHWCEEFVTSQNGPHRATQTRKRNELAHVLEVSRHRNEKRARLQKLSNDISGTGHVLAPGNMVSADFGDARCFKRVRDWIKLHRSVLEDAAQRALLLGPRHPMPPVPTPAEIEAAQGQLDKNKKSVMQGADAALVARLFKDIKASLCTGTVQGLYAKKQRTDQQRTWFVLACDGDSDNEEEEGTVFDPRAAPPGFLYAHSLNVLFWKTLHLHGLSWRARTRQFKKSRFYFRELTSLVALRENDMHHLALIPLASTKEEYADALELVHG